MKTGRRYGMAEFNRLRNDKMITAQWEGVILKNAKTGMRVFDWRVAILSFGECSRGSP